MSNLELLAFVLMPIVIAALGCVGAWLVLR